MGWTESSASKMFCKNLRSDSYRFSDKMAQTDIYQLP